SGANPEGWRLDSLWGARPAVQLRLIDKDSAPDLFFTVHWEEFVFGELWRGPPGTARLAFKSADDACRVPELRDVNSDGLLDVIDWRVGALRQSECSGDALA